MIKIVPALFLALATFACTAQKSVTSTPAISPVTPYSVTYSKGDKVLTGLLTRQDIEGDTTFTWFKEHYKLGRADAAAVETFKENKDKFQMVVFAGTWCEDTQNLLPSFFRLADVSGYDSTNITLIGVDREKTTLNNLHKAFNIIDVPTFIVMKDGKEVGRIVEYGKYGLIDKELGEIVRAMN